MPWMLQWFVLLLSVQWVMLDHLGLMLMDGGGSAPPFMQLRMNLVVQLLCLSDGYVCTTFISPDIFSPFLGCQLIALYKSPGFRPIGVCEVLQCIVAKATLYVIQDDIPAAAGPHQLCAGQIAETEAADHALRSVFNHNDSDAILLVDATNAFNSINCSVALHNIQQLFPLLAHILINTYRSPASMFVSGDIIISEKGTTQGDPLTMPMYAIAIIPLICHLNNDTNAVTQIWYADNACACGRLASLRQWQDQMCKLGPGFGYFPNASKMWLVVKDRCHFEAEVIFADTNVKITNEGQPYLGSTIRSGLYVRQFVEEKLKAGLLMLLFWLRSLRVNHMLLILHLLRVWPVVGSMSLVLSQILTHLCSSLKMLSIVYLYLPLRVELLLMI